jgi:hypothetical protein
VQAEAADLSILPKRRAPSAERRAPSAERRAPSVTWSDSEALTGKESAKWRKSSVVGGAGKCVSRARTKIIKIADSAVRHVTRARRA